MPARQSRVRSQLTRGIANEPPYTCGVPCKGRIGPSRLGARVGSSPTARPAGRADPALPRQPYPIAGR